MFSLSTTHAAHRLHVSRRGTVVDPPGARRRKDDRKGGGTFWHRFEVELFGGNGMKPFYGYKTKKFEDP